MLPRRIKRITTKIIEIPLKDTWRISLYSAKTRHHIIVRLITEDGIEGFGEVSPSPAFMGEEARVIQIVIEKLLSKAVVGLDPFDIELIHTRMDEALHGNGAAKAAIDIALHDLQGKILNVPAYVLMGGKYRGEIPITWVVSIKNDVESALDEVDSFVRKGVETIKVKIGIDHERDYVFLEKLREKYGSRIRLRVDANQGLRSDEAFRVLSKLEIFDLDAIEQPLKAWDLEGMRKLTNSLKTPIMADESVFSLEDAYKVIKMKAADVINIKIGKVGGLYPAKKIAAVAQASGIPVTIGSNLELGVGIAASIHFGVSTPNVLYPCDLAIGTDLHEFDVVQESFAIESGCVKSVEAPGLGCRLKRDLFKD